MTAPRCLLLLCLLSSTASCVDDEGSLDKALRTCEDLPNDGGDLMGKWSLAGSGRRFGCGDPHNEGTLSIETTQDLVISATARETIGDKTGPASASDAEAFADRIARADFELSADSGPDEVSFSGATTGACVSFQLTEELPDGDSQRYDFIGAIVSGGTVIGKFDGRGPEDCLTSGRFEIDIR